MSSPESTATLNTNTPQSALFLPTQERSFAVNVRRGLGTAAKSQQRNRERKARPLLKRDLEGLPLQIFNKTLESLWEDWGVFSNACPEAADLEEHIILFWKESCKFFDVPEGDSLNHIDDESNIQLFNLVQTTFGNNRSIIQTNIVRFAVDAYDLNYMRSSKEEVTARVKELVGEKMLFAVKASARAEGRTAPRYVNDWAFDVIETLFLHRGMKARKTTRQKKLFINAINVEFIALIYAMMEVCIRKHLKGHYDSSICARDKTLFRSYNDHIRAFNRIYNTETRENRFFEHIHTTLIHRLEDREGDDSERTIVEPTEDEFNELDAFFEGLQPPSTMAQSS